MEGIYDGGKMGRDLVHLNNLITVCNLHSRSLCLRDIPDATLYPGLQSRDTRWAWMRRHQQYRLVIRRLSQHSPDPSGLCHYLNTITSVSSTATSILWVMADAFLHLHEGTR